MLAAILLAMGMRLLFLWPWALGGAVLLILGGTEFLPVRWD